MPSDEINRRKRRLFATAKKKGRTPCQKQLALCDWNFYLTNVEANLFPAHSLRHLYSLRWQMEIVFKGIKSNETRRENLLSIIREINYIGVEFVSNGAISSTTVAN
jgi:IS4 transposase